MNTRYFWVAALLLAPARIVAQALPVSLPASADSYIQSGQPNKNNNSDTFIRVQESGSNRGLVRFDQTAIASAVGSAGLASAKLRLSIASNGNNWGSSGGTVGAHRLSVAWSETGATWNCPSDSNLANSAADCSPTWNMTNSASWPFQQTPAAVVTIQNGQSGWVEWDVTADVAAFLAGTAQNQGWMVRKMNESAAGKADFSSREGANPPQLVITTGTPPPPTSQGPIFSPAGDTYVAGGSANQNHGYDTTLTIQSSGPNRTLVRMDQAAITGYVGTTGILQTAKLRLYLAGNGNNWGASGRPVNVHRVTANGPSPAPPGTAPATRTPSTAAPTARPLGRWGRARRGPSWPPRPVPCSTRTIKPAGWSGT